MPPFQGALGINHHPLATASAVWGVAEVVVFSRYLLPAEMLQMSVYFSNKYGLAAIAPPPPAPPPLPPSPPPPPPQPNRALITAQLSPVSTSGLVGWWTVPTFNVSVPGRWDDASGMNNHAIFSGGGLRVVQGGAQATRAGCVSELHCVNLLCNPPNPPY